MEYEKGDIVVCTVESISGTTVFVEIKNGKKGNIVLSEIAPGRIRNLRDYVVPKKKIVCKVLGIKGENLELSLRRVSQKEKKETLDQEKLEKSARSILKSVLKEKTKEIVEKIEKEVPLLEFLEETKKDSKKLEKFVSKEEAEKVLEIINSQKSKKIEIKRTIGLSSSEPNGIEDLKETLGKIKEAEIKYLAAGKYSLKVEEESLKKADQKINDLIEKIKKTAQEKQINFIEK